MRSCLRETTEPPSGSTMPANILSKVDLPAPFGPIRPMRSRSSIPNEMSVKRGRELYDLLIVWQLTRIPKRQGLRLCAEIIAKKLGFFVVSTPFCRKSALIVEYAASASLMKHELRLTARSSQGNSNGHAQTGQNKQNLPDRRST